MRKTFIKDIHLNTYKKYFVKRENEKQRRAKQNLKNHNSMNSTSKDFSIYSTKFNPNTTQNSNEDKKGIENPIKPYDSNRQILTPLQKIRKRFLKLKKKNDTSNSILESFSPLKNKFSLNNIVNSYLFKIYLDNSYKKVLHRRLEPYKKDKKVDIKIDLRQTQHKGSFYIPIIKQRQREPNKKEIGIQSSISYPNIFKNSYDNSNNLKMDDLSNIIDNKSSNNLKGINNKNKVKNDLRLNSVGQRQDYSVIKSNGFNFNKYNLINKKLVNKFKEYSQSCKNVKYTKIKQTVCTEKKKIDKLLNKLRYAQCQDKDKLKFELAKINGYYSKKNKKSNNNSYNLFL